MEAKLNTFPSDLVGSILRKRQTEKEVAQMLERTKVAGALFLEERYKHLANHPDKKTGHKFEAHAGMYSYTKVKDTYLFKAKSSERTVYPSWTMTYIPGNLMVNVVISGNYTGYYSFEYDWPLHELDEHIAKFALLGTNPDKVRKASGG